jgi:hypothetical protein
MIPVLDCLDLLVCRHFGLPGQCFCRSRSSDCHHRQPVETSYIQGEYQVFYWTKVLFCDTGIDQDLVILVAKEDSANDIENLTTPSCKQIDRTILFDLAVFDLHNEITSLGAVTGLSNLTTSTQD